ncbi:MAG: hypothetical protein K1W34_08085 [Lachnospiraceae bacterium]
MLKEITELVSFLLGLVSGAIGCKFIDKKIIKGGKKSRQIQINGANEGDISADKISGNKIISNNPDEFVL